MAKLGLIFIALFLASCGGPPSEEEQISNFNNNSESFELLAKLILKEALKTEQKIDWSGCYSVGIDHIGQYWFESVRGVWSIGPGGDVYDKTNYKLSLSEVLRREGISNKRYEVYTQLFSKTGSERVSYCQSKKLPPRGTHFSLPIWNNNGRLGSGHMQAGG
jgi:hypothetical protein